MSNIKMKEMLAAGMHFGHQTRRWNPKMKPYIFGARNKIYIINLDKTLPLFNAAYDFIANTVAEGGTVMFVGTKRQAQETIKAEANRCGMHFVNHRWLGGMLTNFTTIKQSIDRLKKIEAMVADGTIEQLEVPVDTWLEGARSAVLTVSSSPAVTRVTLDPEQRSPDRDRSNDMWRSAAGSE